MTKDKNIRFTSDGSEPSLTSTIYSSPIPLDKNTIIKAAVFDDDKQLGETFSQNIIFHKAVGKSISLNVALNATYSGSGADGLVNGVSGSNKRYGDKEWLGFLGEDLEITIDLGEETEINSIETRFFNTNGQWIYAPKTVELILDEDTTLKNEIPFSDASIVNVNFDLEAKTRSIKLKIPNYGVISEGKQGAGHKAWTFIDEIIVN